jgi:hypothetical protein
MLIRRAEQAGYVGVTPHQCRHTFSNAWLKSGGSEGDLMRLNGWKSRAMADRYADDVANQRAIEAKRRKGDAIYQPIRPRRWARHDTRARAHVDQRLAGQGRGVRAVAGLLSVTTVAGVGIGYPLAGLATHL